MKFASRLNAVPPYLFAELERRIEEREQAGIDVISLGIGDPDLPTPPAVIEAMAEAVRDSATHQYPSNRGTAAFREAVAGFYAERFGVTIDPETEVIPVLGGKATRRWHPTRGIRRTRPARSSPEPTSTICPWPRRTGSCPTWRARQRPGSCSSTTRTTRPERRSRSTSSSARSRSGASAA